MTKAQLLAQFEGLDKATLEKLLTYSDNLLIPETDLLVNVTASQLIAKAFQYADIYFPNWTDRSHSDFGRFLVELMAVFSEKDFWYMNTFANEGFLQNMLLYSNAYYRSLELGYEPVLFKSATCQMRLTFLPGDEAVIQPGDIVLSRTGSSIKISNTTEFTVEASLANVPLIVDFAVGEYTEKSFLFNGRSVRITDTNIDRSSVYLTVAGVEYSQTESFSQSTDEDKVYLALPEKDASLTILFGDGTFGVRPTPGDEIVVRYRVGGGDTGSLAPSSYSQTIVPDTRGISAVSQLTTLEGGVSQESLESIKANAPRYFQTQDRGVNGFDIQSLLTRQSTVKQAKATFWSQYIYFYVIPSDGTVADATFLTELEEYLQPLVVFGYTVRGNATTYIAIGPLDLTVYVFPGADLEYVASEVQEAVEYYTDPLGGAEYGEEFIFSTFISYLISNVADVQNVVLNEVAGADPSTYVDGKVPVTNVQIMEKIDLTGNAETETTVNGGYKIIQGNLTVTVEYLVP